tara:strand:+ start:174 stop:686 length:513 start_codon:yes stop_codon:yes gene_type:complete
MKRALLLFGMILMSSTSAVRADVTSRFASSVQLSVGGAHTSTERIGSSFSISGSGVDTSITPSGGSAVADQISSGAITSGVYTPGVVVAEQKTAGSAFSFSQSYTQADAIAGSAPTVGAVNNFGDMSSTAGGTVGSLAGSVTSSHGFSGVAAGGANTSATSQFVTEVTIR